MTQPTHKLDAKARETQILRSSLHAAERIGYAHMTLAQVAEAAEVSRPLVMLHFKTMTNLRRKVMREAVRLRNLRVVGQGLVAGDPHARKAPDDLKLAALASFK